MSSLPAELLSSVIALVWQSAHSEARYDEINACSLCCRNLYHESRLWMFQSVEFRLDVPASSPHTPQNPPRVLGRLGQLCALIQANPILGDYITSLALQFPWDDNPESIISQHRDANVAFLLNNTKLLGRLTFESSSRREWHAIRTSVRDAIVSACKSKHISALQFARIVHLPAHVITTSSAQSVHFRDVSLYNAPTSAHQGHEQDNHSLEGQQSGISDFSIEYSSVNEALATWPSTLRNLRRLHTRLAVSTETQQLIDATENTLECLSCDGKAMVRRELPFRYHRLSDTDNSARIELEVIF